MVEVGQLFKQRYVLMISEVLRQKKEYPRGLMGPFEFLHYRQSLGLSRKELSALWGVHVRTIENWETPEEKENHRKVPAWAVLEIQRIRDEEFG